MAKTSLEKSHSKASNAKLTLLCFLGSLGFAALFAGLGLITFNTAIGAVVAGVGGVLFLLSWLALGKFTR